MTSFSFTLCSVFVCTSLPHTNTAICPFTPTFQVSFDTAAVKGRHVLLVDDLCDSGLTLSEVHRLVLEAGAASVK